MFIKAHSDVGGMVSRNSHAVQLLLRPSHRNIIISYNVTKHYNSKLSSLGLMGHQTIHIYSFDSLGGYLCVRL